MKFVAASRLLTRNFAWHQACGRYQHTSPLMETNHTIEVLNSLLRGEISAIETYAQAINKFPDSTAHRELRELQTAHIDSAELLRELVTECGGNPSSDSGPWGGFAKSVEAVAAMLGETSALDALKQGEAHGIEEYVEALEDETLDQEVKGAIREQLLAPLQEHVLTLESLA